MMRSLFSGVAGLRTHQTRMDVIGNNIANVNTVAYKSSSMTFQDLLYQTTSNASGANAATGRAGINAKQIGLGVSTGSIATSIATGGSNEQTGNPFDIKINGSSFFVVNDGSNQYYTRAGAFNVDAEGTLCMSSNGYNVMGYRTTENAMGDVVIDTSQLRTLDIMSERNQVNDPMMTERSYLTGIIDKNDDALHTDKGKVVSFAFYDNLGYSYTAQFAIKPVQTGTGDNITDVPHKYTIEMTDIFDSDGRTILRDADGNDLSDADKKVLLSGQGTLSSGVQLPGGATALSAPVFAKKIMTFNEATGSFSKIAETTFTAGTPATGTTPATPDTWTEDTANYTEIDNE
ncbi:MAG: flagellar hook-basal body complex protein, partial [Lachnospiraceae bacterium]|nr:flagellar hook-basal body complex protein [Lachnospiraceae bacterium]